MSYPLGPDPESLFAAWLDRLVGGEDPDIDELCREHLEAATALRALHAHWVQLEAVVRQCCMGRSLADKLRAHFGGEVDPQVTLEHESAPRSDFTREVLSRLGGRGPAATRYRIQGEVAHGGMGAVLRVWDLDLRRHLAMKVMLAKTRARPDEDPTPTEERFLARFLEEAQVTAQLDHPGIVPVHELGLDAQGHVYFTMKLVKGQTLKEVLDDVAGGRGHWKPQRVLGVLLKVCEAMSYAHDKGVIHRDLKPANVMVGRYGEVYVMDWGLAKIRGRADDKDIHIRGRTDDASTIVSSERSELSGESSLCTMEGDVVGTPAYMPPEQALGRVAEMGPASDVYALGAMLYHLLAGHMPYVPAGARPNNYAVWRQVQSGPPRALEHEAPQAPAEVVAICKRAMARSPSARYADMTALASDLAAYLDCRVVYAYEAGAWAEARKWVRRNRPLAASLAAALLLAVGGSASTAWVQARGRAAERVQKERADAEAAAAHANMLLAQGSEAQSKAQQVRAEQQQSRAEQSERQANEERAKVLRLSDVRAVHQLLGESDRLWPPHPVRIDEIRKWVESAGALVGRLPMHRETLDELRSHARPWNA
ncbi:MAG TPA: serine/threonine-protein kinase, partial [Planctomycetota bacterium]|nr:serine/threonine-protein kinase [Planctomycetota bacterium]